MVNLAAMVWRRLLRKRWVLALVFGLSLVYFLSSTFKQEERAVRDRNLLQVQDHDQPIPWKVQFHLGNSSRPGNQCRNSIQGKHLITDELGYICERKDLLVNGCCNVNVPGTKQYRCDGCLPNGCCSAYEYCVSCCLQPSKVRGAAPLHVPSSLCLGWDFMTSTDVSTCSCSEGRTERAPGDLSQLSIRLLISAQVIISRFVGLSPALGSVLTVRSPLGMSLSFSLSLSLSLSLPRPCGLALKINKH
ncbi:SREBP regulating gene protein isoform X1 [Panthera uncia]|uniref:SREBP regulating gene protein isoform X1 n=1 Tax=Panthera uncia TaxID=29064 RepID=UPI0020FF9259|nr:SREBP regulating gene protein isoform X1 [Panthera uncia]